MKRRTYFIGKRKDFERLRLTFSDELNAGFFEFGEELPVLFEEKLQDQVIKNVTNYYKRYNAPIIILLSSLEIPGLKGFPGVAFDYVIDKIGVHRFSELIGKGSRDALYKVFMAYISPNDYFEMESQIKGKITKVPSEESIEGILIPEGYGKTIAELDEKVEISPLYRVFKTLLERLAEEGKAKKPKEYVEIGEEVVVDTVLDKYQIKRVNRKVKVLMDPDTGVIMKIPVEVLAEE